AVTFWPVAQGRYALRAALLPVWVALMLAAWWRALDTEAPPEARPAGAPSLARGSTPWRASWLLAAALAGACLGLATLTHITGRLLPAILVASTAAEVAAGRPRRAGAALIVALVMAAAVAAPLVAYFAGHPDMLAYRADQVSILNPAVNEGDLPGAIWDNVRDLARTPIIAGDGSWYHNLSRRPVFDPLAGIGFLLGAALVARDLTGRAGGRRRRAAVMLVAALAVTVAPSALSQGAPNYVRLTGTWPVLFLLPALGIEAAAAAVDSSLARGLAWQPLPAGGRPRGASRVGSLRPSSTVNTGTILAVGVVALTGVATARDYFGPYAGAGETRQAFNGAAVERGHLVAGMAAEGPLYVTPAVWRQSVIRFLNVAAPPRSVDPRAGLVLPPRGDATYAFDPVETVAAADFAGRHPSARRQDILDSRGRLALIVYRMAPDVAPWGPPPPAIARFGEAIELLRLEASTRYRTAVVTMEWRAIAPTKADRNLFIHVLDGGGHSLGQFDGPPLGGSYGTDGWLPGERIRQVFEVDAAATPGEDDVVIETGWYDWRDGTRLAVPGTADDAVRLPLPFGGVRLRKAQSPKGD
ncbi:MAG: hypothetical protein ACE5EL_04380, partial [Anaerolineae bacterium]